MFHERKELFSYAEQECFGNGRVGIEADHILAFEKKLRRYEALRHALDGYDPSGPKGHRRTYRVKDGGNRAGRMALQMESHPDRARYGRERDKGFTRRPSKHAGIQV